MMGWITPSRSMDCVSSIIATGSNSRRGWLALGFTLSMGTHATSPSLGVVGTGAAGAASALRVGSNELSPLPSALRRSLLFMGENLFCQLDICFRAARARVVQQNWFAVARSFGQPDTPGDNGFQHLI